MPPKCRLQTGQNAGIKPRGCTFQTDNQGMPMRSRSAATTGTVADNVSVAKQRPQPNARKVFRRVRITYQGRSYTSTQLYTLDTGAHNDLITTRAHFEHVLPPRGRHASKWARFTSENPLPVVNIRGVGGSQRGNYQADIVAEVEVNIGRKGSGQTEFRGGPARAIIVDGGNSYLVGAQFMRKHRILVK
jgi:hypothetical protein